MSFIDFDAFLKFNLYVVILYVVYRVFLRQVTFYRLNRFYLILAPMVAALVAWIKPEAPVAETPVIYLDELAIFGDAQTTAAASTSTNWVLWTYLVIAACLFVRLTYGVISLIRLRRKHEMKLISGISCVDLPQQSAAFSFFGWLFIGNNSEPIDQAVVEHEHAHVRQWHSIDRLYYEILAVLFWFNPVFWALRKETLHVHEYLADQEVLRNVQLKEYATLLVGRHFKVDSQILTNNFYSKTLLKKRIMMLYKKPSNRIALSRYLAVIPAIVLMSFASSCIKTEKEDPKNDQTKVKVVVEGDEVFTVVEKMPEFPGGQQAMFAYIGEKLTYPEAAKEAGASGKAFIQFIVDETGQVTNVENLQKIGYGLDEAAAQVISSMPKWNPGEQKGKKVKVKMILPIKFHLE